MLDPQLILSHLGSDGVAKLPLDLTVLANLVPYEVPMTDRTREKSLVINWARCALPEKIEPLFPKPRDDREALKLANTLAFFKWLDANGHVDRYTAAQEVFRSEGLRRHNERIAGSGKVTER